MKALSLWDLGPHKVRELINQKIQSIDAEKPDVKYVKDITLNHNNRITTVRLYLPNDDPNIPVILLIHGGGWVGGNLDTHDNMARYLCSKVQALVISVDYLNSPEGKFPLPLEQCYDAFLWTIDHAKEYNADATRLAIIGDSAGGNMAAALCLLNRDRKGPKIDLQVLINPSPDLSGKGTLQQQGDAHDATRWFASQYVSDPTDVYNPYVSPIMAKDLTNLPAALLILAEKDDLCSDGKRYADRLIEAGICTNIYIQWGMGHLAGNAAKVSLQAQESLDIAVAAVSGAFRKQTINR